MSMIKVKEEEKCIFDDSKICSFAYYEGLKREALLQKYCIPCRIGKSNTVVGGLVIFAIIMTLINLILVIYWVSSV